MDTTKVGELIQRLRREKGWTQAALAALIGVSDKAVSKWERGLGCPDVSLLPEISAAFGVNIEGLLRGALPENERDAGNMKRLKFYICGECGNVFTASSPTGEVSCCGRKLSALDALPADAAHEPKREEIDGEFCFTFAHEMTKKHHIAFAALAGFDRFTLVKLYPEQDACVRLPAQWRGTLYLYCTEHGLFSVKL